MEEIQGVCSGWSWEENKLFELALAVVDERNPGRWSMVAAMVGGKSAADVEKHYWILVEDLQCIESGRLDHTIDELQLHPLVGCDGLQGWTDEDQKSRHQLNLHLDLQNEVTENENNLPGLLDSNDVGTSRIER